MRARAIGLAVIGGLAAPLLLGGCTTPASTTAVTQQQQVVIVTPGAATAPPLPPGGIYACALEPKLNAIVGTQHITLIFSNQTGDDISLFWLDYNGHRKFYDKIENGRAKGRPTFITHPWLITDAKGQCIEIVLPGLTTQTVVVRNPPNTPTPSSPPAPSTKQ
jgi:hypothetical protein